MYPSPKRFSSNFSILRGLWVHLSSYVVAVKLTLRNNCRSRGLVGRFISEMLNKIFWGGCIKKTQLVCNLKAANAK